MLSALLVLLPAFLWAQSENPPVEQPAEAITISMEDWNRMQELIRQLTEQLEASRKEVQQANLAHSLELQLWKDTSSQQKTALSLQQEQLQSLGNSLKKSTQKISRLQLAVKIEGGVIIALGLLIAGGIVWQ